MNIILSIPGPWDDVYSLEQAIAKSDSGYQLKDGILTDASYSCRLELSEYDADLRQSFEYANRHSLNQADLDRIETHRSCAYLIRPGGSLDAGRQAMSAATVLLSAGGYAVKVESAGVAHSAADWLTQTQRSHTHVGALYISYVALISRQGQVYSCGMHNLGFADAIVSVAQQSSAPAAGELLRGLLMSVVHDRPVFISGASTLGDGSGARYLLTLEACTTFTPDDPYFNPNGLWRLTPML